MAEDDVEGEERGVREREGDAERLRDESDVREEVHAGHGRGECEPVPPRPQPERCERDHRQELDRRDRPERQPVDREVEAGVHRPERGAEEQQQAASSASSRPPRPRHGRRQAANRRARDQATRPRLAARARRAAPRTPGRGSGRRRFRRRRSRAGRRRRACRRCGRVHPGPSVAATVGFRKGRSAAFPHRWLRSRGTRPYPPYEPALLDDINRRLLEELQADAHADDRRARAPREPLGSRRRRARAAARARRRDRRLPRGTRPQGARLADCGDRPHPPRDAAAPQDPGDRGGIRRSSSAVGSPARTVTSSTFTCARWTTWKGSSTASSPTGRRQRRSCTRRRSPPAAPALSGPRDRSSCRGDPHDGANRFAKTSRSAPAPRRLSKETFAIPAKASCRSTDDQRPDERVSPQRPVLSRHPRWIDRWLAACSNLAELERSIR